MLVGVAVVAALAVAGGAAWALLGLRGAGGAASPEDAAEAMLRDFAALDYAKVIAHVAPSERSLLDPLIEAGQQSAKDSDQAKQAQELIERFQDSVTVEFKDLEFASQSIAEGVDRTALAGGTITLDADTAKLASAIMDSHDLGADTLGGLFSQYSGLGPITESEVRSQLESIFPVSKGIDDLVAESGLSDLFLVTVKEDGKWFTSASMTMAQYAYESAGLDNAALGDPIPEGEMRGASNPEAALANLVAAVAATGESGDPRELAKALPVAESRLLAVYGPALTSGVGGALAWPAIEATGSQHSEISGHTRITLDSLTIASIFDMSRSNDEWTFNIAADGVEIIATLTQEGDWLWRLSVESGGAQSLFASLQVKAKGEFLAALGAEGVEGSIEYANGCATVTSAGSSRQICGADLGLDLADWPINDLEKLPDLMGVLGVSAVKGAGGDWYISPLASALDAGLILADELQ
ncbi:MAG: hypothetical protein LBD70_03880 [Bifidobacteriaceae bacterium]|nr:hypothetical protein [Bifidobacteriaceae bacterium]